MATAGSVDDGKSTLIGRLLLETGSVPEDQLEDARRATSAAARASGLEVDLSLLTDGLLDERAQGITIDVAWRHVRAPRRSLLVADCPGHRQYTRNFVTGASACEAALLLVDARAGLLQQTRRHALLTSLLGLRHVVVAVNKMDLVAWDRDVFERVRAAFVEFSTRLDVPDLAVIPVSARDGDNVVRRGERSPWYEGPTLLAHLESLHAASDRNLVDLRLPVQLVLRGPGNERALAGTLASGVLRPGDEVVALPSGTRARVTRVAVGAAPVDEAFAPMAVAVSLDREVDVGRGEVLARPENLPRASARLDAMLVVLGDAPITPGSSWLLKLATTTVRAQVESVRYEVDPDTLRRRLGSRGDALGQDAIGRVVVTTTTPLVHDPYRRNRALGAFILIDPTSAATVAAGMILEHEERAGPTTSRGAATCVWLTGLPASGKSTLARALQDALRARGQTVVVLDGDDLRAGLNAGLGFSPADRAEVARRTAAVARLLVEQGVTSIVALVSPAERDRAAARALFDWPPWPTPTGPGRFVLVHVATPVAACRARDPKGLYARADRGELPDLTGVGAPFEVPPAPDVVVDASVEDPAACAASVLTAVLR